MGKFQGREPGNEQDKTTELLEDLEELAVLLKSETDPWSRRLILEEAADRLAHLERAVNSSVGQAS